MSEVPRGHRPTGHVSLAQRGQVCSPPRGYAPSRLCSGLWGPNLPPRPPPQPHPRSSLILRGLPLVSAPTCFRAVEHGFPLRGSISSPRSPSEPQDTALAGPPQTASRVGLLYWPILGRVSASCDLGPEVLLWPGGRTLLPEDTLPKHPGEPGEDIRAAASGSGQTRSSPALGAVKPPTRPRAGVSSAVVSTQVWVRHEVLDSSHEAALPSPATTHDAMSQLGAVSCCPGAAK